MVNIASVSVFASAFVSAACVAVFYSSTLAQPRPARVRPVSSAAVVVAAPLVVVVLLSPLTLHATVHFVFTAIFFLVVHN